MKPWDTTTQTTHGYNYKNWQDQVLVKVRNWELSNSANGTENN